MVHKTFCSFYLSRSVAVPMFAVSSTILISAFALSCHCCRDLHQGRLPVGLLISTFRIILPSARHTWPAHSSRLAFKKYWIFDLLHRDFRLVFFLLSWFLVKSFLTGPYIFLSTFLSKIRSFSSSPRQTTSHRHMSLFSVSKLITFFLLSPMIALLNLIIYSVRSMHDSPSLF